MKTYHLNTMIAQFIPILLFFVIASNLNGVVLISHTILGKLIAVIIIIFYTTIEPLLGILVCMAIILFYQTDYVENMLNMYEWNDESYPEYSGMFVDVPVSVNQFRQENCINGNLKYKNMDVTNDMAHHIFPEIKFNKHICDPCSNTCDISIIESDNPNN
jgi:hypothetical protein